MSSPLDYARAGVPIIPLKVSFENGRWRKRPHIKDWAARATTNEATIEAWWHSWPLALVGVPLEPLNLVVVDADRHPGGPDGVAALSAIALPPHQAVVTMSNGEHRFFRQPAPPAPRIRFVQFDGGQILGDGRLVAAYSLAPFITPAPVLPRDLLDRLPQARVASQINKHTPAPFVADAKDKEIPKSLYHELLRLMPLSNKTTRHDLRRARGILWIITSKCQGEHRNGALHDASSIFRELIYTDAATRHAAEQLLLRAAELCGYVAQDGADAAMATIRSGLGSAGLDTATNGAGCVFDQII